MRKLAANLGLDIGEKGGIAIGILTIYVWILLTLQSISVDLPISIVFEIIIGFISFILSFITIGICGKAIHGFFVGENGSSAKAWGWASFIFFFLTSFICLLAFYPGGISDDTLNQFEQAMGLRPYSNWHPALHTFLFFTLPLNAGPYIGLVVFYQVLFYSAAMAYLIYSLVNNGIRKWACILFVIYMLVNPFVLTYLMFPWKDIAFMIFAVWGFGCYIQIFVTNGEWLERKVNLVIFAAVLAITYYMRHNASLFVIPLLVIVIIYILKNKKLRLALAGVFVTFVLLIKVLYMIVGVENAPGRTVEVIGLPVTIWCNVMKENPDALSDSTREAMLSLASLEDYQGRYETGSFNGFKTSGYIDLDKIDTISLIEAAKYTLECFIYSPKESWEALAKLTDVVWDIDGKCMPCIPIIVENDYGFSENYNEYAYNLVMTIILFCTDGIGKIIFGSFGFIMLAELVIGLGLLAWGRKGIIHILPVFCYNFVTMLLLSGEDYRLFLITIPLAAPSIFMMLKDRKTFKTKVGSKE